MLLLRYFHQLKKLTQQNRFFARIALLAKRISIAVQTVPVVIDSLEGPAGYLSGATIANKTILMVRFLVVHNASIICNGELATEAAHAEVA